MRTVAIIASLGLLLGLFSFGAGATAASVDTTCANRELAQVEMVTQREIAVLCETNMFRQREGLPPLKLDPVLSSVARAHARDMVERGYFDHTNPDGLSPFDRIDASSYGSYDSAGENIAAGQRTPAEVVRDWIDSSGHRDNMLGDRADIGVGIHGDHYVQIFAGPGAGRNGITGLEPEYQGAPAPGVSGFRVVRVKGRQFRLVAGLATGQSLTVTARFRKRVCVRRAGKRRCRQVWSRPLKRVLTITDGGRFRLAAFRGNRVRVRFLLPGFTRDGATYPAFRRSLTIR